VERYNKRHELNVKLKELGQLTEIDILNSSERLSELIVLRDNVAAEKFRTIFELRVLAGNQDIIEHLSQKVDRLPMVPESVVLHSISDVLQQRPDIVSAKNKLKAAVHNYQIQHSLWWPRINLTGSVGYVSTELSDIGKSDSVAKVFNPNLQWSALNFLSLKARIKSANKQAQVNLLEYEKIVTRSIYEVHGALRLFDLYEKQVHTSKRQVKSAQQSQRLINTQFEKGAANQFDVYNSQDNSEQAITNLINNEAELLYRLIDVYRAVGA